MGLPAEWEYDEGSPKRETTTTHDLANALFEAVVYMHEFMHEETK